jgi:(1->4)-alpha-D-glucan 1-alpha-D-glucosylmutase
MYIPTATYRIQFTPSFGFKEAREIVQYLSKLGISTLYASPIFKATKGSTHGYDVVDPNELNQELGSVQDFEDLITDLKGFDIGWIQDIVPNHMAYVSENHMLMDILERGERSRYCNFFDIDWHHPYESLKERLLAPFLGKTYAQSLEEGEITLGYGSSGLTINYYDLKLPLKIETYINVLTYRLGTLQERLGEEHPDYIKFLGVLYVLRNLSSAELRPDDNHMHIDFVKRLLWELYTKNDIIKRFLDENIDKFNREVGDSKGVNLLHDLLSEQYFRLSFWKVATEEINYRRFFNINKLITLRVEDEEVFNQTHFFTFNLIEEGKIDGLRIDHIDGLYDPTVYLNRIKAKDDELYMVVEKILDFDEDLPEFWPVQGTTGYDFLSYVNGLFCNKRNEKIFDKIYKTFTDYATPYNELVADKKRLIIGKHMAGDIDNLAHILKSISSRDIQGSDITLYGLKRALVEVMALFPVYRTYISNEIMRESDRIYISMAIEGAKRTSPGLLIELDFIEDFLLLRFEGEMNAEEKKKYMDFVMRFQQFTAPLRAKGFEDTTLYVYNRLLSLNDVGGTPDRFGITVSEFNDFNRTRAELWPHSMNATSTHDTKRGEDVRARINVLSEMPKQWERFVKTCSRINRIRKTIINGASLPDKNDEYFLYQTLVGAYPFDDNEVPFFAGRIKDYIIKAIREAKVHTAWLKPDTTYEDSFLSFIDGILDSSSDNQFIDIFRSFQKKVAHYGVFNSLSQTLLKITSPGVPDFYQGTELWDLSLVDPDNRRPVDFSQRHRHLNEIIYKDKEDNAKLIDELISKSEDGRIKLFLIHKSLKARNHRKDFFQEGDYMPLVVRGEFKDHVVSFARREGKIWAITVVPRLLVSVVNEDEFPIGERVWEDTHILLPKNSADSWKDAFTDKVITGDRILEVGNILEHFPVSLLLSHDTGDS